MYLSLMTSMTICRNLIRATTKIVFNFWESNSKANALSSYPDLFIQGKIAQFGQEKIEDNRNFSVLIQNVNFAIFTDTLILRSVSMVY